MEAFRFANEYERDFKSARVYSSKLEISSKICPLDNEILEKARARLKSRTHSRMSHENVTTFQSVNRELKTLAKRTKQLTDHSTFVKQCCTLFRRVQSRDSEMH